MKHRILILGSHGYIGRNLVKYLEPRAEICFHNRKLTSIAEALDSFKPTVVVNSSASRLNDGFAESLDANFLYQVDCLKKLLSSNSSLIWIQLSSYYELQIPFGRNDFYSTHKKFFTDLLEDLESRKLINLRNVFLPHVFGLDEKSTRLIPSIKRAKQKLSRVEFSAGQQFIPILHVDDACSAIWKAIDSGQSTSSASPIWYGRVRELIDLLLEPQHQSLVQFDAKRIEVDDSFPKIQFPKAVSGWNAQYQIENLIQEFSEMS